MGRYVTGDFEWKFAFGTQGSNFGEVLEMIVNDCDDVYLDRYIGSNEQGEIVEFEVASDDGCEDFIKAVDEYIGDDFKIIIWDSNSGYTLEEEKEKGATEEYWSKLMMLKFKEDVEIVVDEKLSFYVEY